MTPERSEQDARLVEAARHVYGRYATEFVEGFGMCPWAARSRAEGHTREVYLVGEQPDEAATLDALDAMGAAPDVEVGLIIFPRVDVDRAEFERFVTRIREADVARCRPGRAPMALAAFHPTAEPHHETPYRLVPFVRRAPDPLIQCVRIAILDDLRKQDRGTNYVDPSGKDLLALFKSLQERKPPLHERVAERNREVLLERGIASATALLDDIRDERNRLYAPLGVRPR